MNNPNDIFASVDKKYLVVRNGMINLIDQLNAIAETPYDAHEEFHTSPDFLPVHWVPEQFYLFLEYIYIKDGWRSIGVVLLDEKNLVTDFVIGKAVAQKNSKGRHSPFIHFSYELLPDTPSNQKFIADLNASIKNGGSVNIMVKEFVRNQFNLENCLTFTLPYNIKDLIINLQLPSINLDAAEFYNALIEFVNFGLKTKKNSPMSYLMDPFQLGENIFQFLKKALMAWDNIDLDKWAQIWVDLFDGTNENWVMMLNNQPTIAFKVIVDNRKISINPIPTYLLKLPPKTSFTPALMAQNLSQKTGTRTVVFNEQYLLDFIKYFAKSNSSPFELLAYTISLLYSSTWAPKSLLDDFLDLFGLKIGFDFQKFPMALKKVFSLFEHVLLIVFSDNTLENPHLSSIVIFNAENENVDVKLVVSEKYRQLFNTSSGELLTRFQIVKEAIEKDLNYRFKVSLGFDFRYLNESVSSRNIQALLNMNRIAVQIPMIASLGVLFAGMKALGKEGSKNFVNPNLEELPPTPAIESPIQKMQLPTFYNEFLKKGVLCLFEDNPEIIQKIYASLDIFHDDLGIDIELLRTMVNSKNPK